MRVMGVVWVLEAGKRRENAKAHSSLIDISRLLSLLKLILKNSVYRHSPFFANSFQSQALPSMLKHKIVVLD